MFFAKVFARSKAHENIGTGNCIEITAYIRKLNIESFPSFPAFSNTCIFELLGITEMEI
jgi:hypothetical protein